MTVYGRTVGLKTGYEPHEAEVFIQVLNEQVDLLRDIGGCDKIIYKPYEDNPEFAVALMVLGETSKPCPSTAEGVLGFASPTTIPCGLTAGHVEIAGEAHEFHMTWLDEVPSDIDLEPVPAAFLKAWDD